MRPTYSINSLWVMFLSLVLLSGLFYIHLFYAHPIKIYLSDFISTKQSVNMSFPIFWEMRFPRTMVTFMAGSSMAIAGALLQTVLHNSLASPTTIGISSFASLSLCTALSFNLVGQPQLLILLALISCLLGMFFIQMLSTFLSGHQFPDRLLLLGIAFSTISASLTQIIIVVDEFNTQSLLFWLLGGVDNKSMIHVYTLLATLSLGFVLSLFYSNSLQGLTIGDEMAISIGHRPEVVKRKSMFIAAILIAGVIATCGPLHFIGLIIPHAIQIKKKLHVRTLIIRSFFLGGPFLLLCDFINRVIFSSLQISVGITSALIGPLYLLYIFSRKRSVI